MRYQVSGIGYQGLVMIKPLLSDINQVQQAIATTLFLSFRRPPQFYLNLRNAYAVAGEISAGQKVTNSKAFAYRKGGCKHRIYHYDNVIRLRESGIKLTVPLGTIGR